MDYPFSRAFAVNPKQLTVSVYRYVLDSFVTRGRVPALAEIRRDLGLEHADVVDALRDLEVHNALRLDPSTAWIGEVYPYSAGETRHKVVFGSGVVVHCMCAIDCFYVPFLTGSDVTVYSGCHVCECDIEIRLVSQRVEAVKPCSTVVWDSDAPYDCPTTNFFCCDAHMQEWKNGTVGESGTVRSIGEALERGRVAAAAILRVIAV